MSTDSEVTFNVGIQVMKCNGCGRYFSVIYSDHRYGPFVAAEIDAPYCPFCGKKAETVKE